MSQNNSDVMIARLEKEIEERAAFIEGTSANAQDAERDLTDNEMELIGEARKRIEVAEEQLEVLTQSVQTQQRARKRADDLQKAMSTMRQQVDQGDVEYRSAGAYALDAWKASIGDRQAADRLEVFTRAADHQKTGDNPGVVPDPIVGDVINFIDAARPIVSFAGTGALNNATFYRPKVGQRTTVGVQGSAGEPADEKAELDSQKMTITRLQVDAVTYGGYVNVSRQNIDFSSPQIMDIVINDLAAQYAVETEAAAAAALEAATGSTSVIATSANAEAVTAGLWAAAANVYNAVRGQGRLFIAASPGRLGQLGPLFAPVNPRDAQSPGFEAGNFGQGLMGTISGIPVVMSAGLSTNGLVLASTAAFELYEQRIGTLQVIEPSVLGVQVAYAGYFAELLTEGAGVHVFTTA